MGNTSGEAYALTVITPILDGHESSLREYLKELPTGSRSPLARPGTVHFARWIVLHDLVYQGEPQRRDTLSSPYLLFTANFDGELVRYLADLRRLMAAEADQIWGHCAGYPGSADEDAFVAYLRHNQLDTEFFFAAYAGASVEDVLTSLDIADRFTSFAISAQDLDPVACQERFAKEFMNGAAL